jgi:glycogen operon protein
MPRIERSATEIEQADRNSRDGKFMSRDLAKHGIGIDAAPKALHGRGNSFPLGATLSNGGTNFSVFAKHSTAAKLLLFDAVDDPEPSCVIDLDQYENRTYHYWHVFVSGVTAGQIYGYRVLGPFDPASGLRFDPEKVLLDPYGKCIAVPARRSREAARQPGDNAATALRSVVVDPSAYDWEGDAPPRRSFAKTIVYEMHVASFTRHPSSGVAPLKRGTYAGLIDKIPYLQDLGISAIELLPVFAFDEDDSPPGLKNYWGYQPLSFFAPHPGYSSRFEPLGVLDEFRDMVKALHRAGIEVLLDVVYNHTAESDESGPTISLRGLSNNNYYILADDKSRYADFTGCGNTLNTNEPIVRRLILDSLRYWVMEMHVDGFRFDLASILARDENGRPMASPPILWDIESDPVLANVKLIAEAWDAAGLYQVGSFVGDSWKEWNGKFRDDVRSFLKSDNGTARAVAFRLTGSPDIYETEEREPEQSINFVTCHDGFTLNDLVSFNVRHNELNGERNRDGTDYNLSWNCGNEGPTTDPAIERLRKRQIKNFLTLTLLAIGTPMLLMGDEVRRSQDGNNNGYCQDNETSWFDWGSVEKHADIHRFAKKMIALRMNRDLSGKRHEMTLSELLRKQPIEWHGVNLNAPDWGYDSHTVAATVQLLGYRLLLHLIINAYWEPLDFELPPRGAAQGLWRRCIDTYLNPPEDICDLADALQLEGSSYRVQPRSVVLLLAGSD